MKFSNKDNYRIVTQDFLEEEIICGLQNIESGEIIKLPIKSLYRNNSLLRKLSLPDIKLVTYTVLSELFQCHQDEIDTHSRFQK